MNLYAFIASLVSSLAWPVLIGFSIWLLIRKGGNVVGLIQMVRKYIKTVKVGSIELTLQDAREDAEAVAIEQGAPLVASTHPTEEFITLAETRPAFVVLDIWNQLEATIIKLIQHNGMIRFTRPDHFMKVLVDQQKITYSEFALYQRLRLIRNETVHSRESRPLTAAEVLEYTSFVSTLIKRLDEIRTEPGYITVPEAKKAR